MSVALLRKGLHRMSELLSNQITPLLTRHQYDIELLQEIMEMNTYVNFRASYEDIYNPTRYSIEESWEKYVELQTLFLACKALDLFLSPVEAE